MTAPAREVGRFQKSEKKLLIRVARPEKLT
jgi:hypothetical protein